MRCILVVSALLLMLLTTIGIGFTQADDGTSDAENPRPVLFNTPIRLEAAGQLIRLDSPGYASPCWADLDGDGNAELLVGQFAGGKIKVYEHKGDLKFSEGEWLQVKDADVSIPGVW